MRTAEARKGGRSLAHRTSWASKGGRGSGPLGAHRWEGGRGRGTRGRSSGRRVSRWLPNFWLAAGVRTAAETAQVSRKE